MIRNLQELGPNLQKIITRLMANQKLIKLLYYTDKDPLSQPDLTQEQIKNTIYEKLLKVVPDVGSSETAQSIVALRVNGGTANENSEFIDIGITFEVFVPLKQWIIKDANFRPFCIMGAIKESLAGKSVDGFGKIRGGDFSISFITDEMSCYDINFTVTNFD